MFGSPEVIYRPAKSIGKSVQIMYKLTSNKILIFIGAVVTVLATFFAFDGGRVIDIIGGGDKKQLAGIYSVSAISGTECQNAKRRPMAVMLASDPEARPLSGIGEAEMVFEMPVEPGGITRMMAVFQCHIPKEIGSIRSARLDFVPLAQGLGAIYAHWGGEKEVLKQLDADVLDNIDGLKYENIFYFRKNNKPRPHNGFISDEMIAKAITKLEYSQEVSFAGYTHGIIKGDKGDTSPPEIFSGSYDVRWEYDSQSNSYIRYRNGSAEIDSNTGEQVRSANVVIMETTWSPIDRDYIRVGTVGSGKAVVYQNGRAVSGQWKKEDDKGKLLFLDDKGKEVNFVQGSIWVEITIN